MAEAEQVRIIVEVTQSVGQTNRKTEGVTQDVVVTTSGSGRARLYRPRPSLVPSQTSSVVQPHQVACWFCANVSVRPASLAVRKLKCEPLPVSHPCVCEPFY